MPGDQATLLVVGTIRLPAANVAAALPAMTAIVAASRAEDGCFGYSYANDVTDPGLIHVSEAWRDAVALDRHLGSDHLRAWRAEWPRLGIGDRDLRCYAVGAPIAT